MQGVFCGEIRMKDAVLIFLTVFLSLLFASLCFLIGYASKKAGFNLPILESGKQCSNLTSFEDKINCLNKNLSSWWIYNISNDEKYNMNDSELYAEGGVCHNAAEWYVEQAQNIGLEGKTDSFWGDGIMGHTIVIIYDKNLTEYAILDQQEIIGLGYLSQ
jgi:hypothetical protein